MYRRGRAWCRGNDVASKMGVPPSLHFLSKLLYKINPNENQSHHIQSCIDGGLCCNAHFEEIICHNTIVIVLRSNLKWGVSNG